MDQIRPTPRSGLLGSVADGLLGVRGFANQAQVPEGIPLVGGVRAGDFLMGQLPEAIDNLSYGDSPFVLPPAGVGSRLPVIKTGRKDEVADLALAGLPLTGLLGKGGARALASGVPSGAGPVLRAEQVGAITPAARLSLEQLIERFNGGSRRSETIRDAINLTPEQRSELSAVLAQRWGRPFDVPASIPLKPLHGFESRVEKQGFSPQELRDWYVSAAADDARVTTAHRSGQPALTNRYFDEARGRSYDVNLPIVSDALGNVYGDGVIPKGIFGPNSPKKR